MQMARPTRCLLIALGLTLFFLTASTEAMARSGGAGGAGGSGGGFGSSPGGSIRGGPPGSYRMRRVYDNSLSGAANQGRSASQLSSQPPERSTTGSGAQPSTPSTSEPSQPSLQIRQQQALSREKRRQRSASPEKRYENYRSITEKYEKLREDRHQEYWDQQK